MATTRAVKLKERPQGTPTEADFEIVEVEIPEPKDGEVRVENLWMSVDPYMRGRMSGIKTYVDPFEVGALLDGGAVGRVVASKAKGLAEGDLVLSQLGWREAFVAKAKHLRRLEVPDGAQPQAFLGVLGMPGLTAYVGLTRIAELKPGERVFVSGAAGAVGSVVCQIGKAMGATVVGSAGSEAKIRWLLEVAGIDGALNYKEVKLRKALGEAMPEGIDVYFENVGGAHLEAAIFHMREFGRIALCGLIAQYNEKVPPPGPRNLSLVLTRRVKLQGFIVTDHGDLQGEFLEKMAGWIRGGQVRWEETVHEGLDAAPAAFLGLFTGENLGKMLVRLGR